MSTLIFAAALLAAPPGTPSPRVSVEEWPAVRATLIGLTLEMELLDEREDRLARYEQWDRDIDELRRRRVELADAPLLADAQRLPPRRVIEEWLQFNRLYRGNLQRRRQFTAEAAAELDAAIRETDDLHRTWEAARDATCEIYYAPVRREALKRFRERIGSEAYWAGQFPPYVPVWRFVEIK
jgi:hypothetical protein